MIDFSSVNRSVSVRCETNDNAGPRSSENVFRMSGNSQWDMVIGQMDHQYFTSPMGGGIDPLPTKF